jgi:hypothetical protein
LVSQDFVLISPEETMNDASRNDKYFDLHITGIGYLYRAREVEVRRGQSFLAG